MTPRIAAPGIAFAVALLFAVTPSLSCAEVPASANAAFDRYIRTVEARLAAQHACQDRFIAPPSSNSKRENGPVIERIRVTPLPGALLHHWRATQFVPGAKAADLDRLLRNYSAYPSLFAPQVERTRAMSTGEGPVHLTMRVRQHHLITVVLDSDYEIRFGQLDSQRRYSISRSTQVREIDSPDTPAEHVLSPDREHGFLWRQNTYWSYEERDGGLHIQVESISLTRSIPTGLGWAVGPYIESIPRDSLSFTLERICSALLRSGTTA